MVILKALFKFQILHHEKQVFIFCIVYYRNIFQNVFLFQSILISLFHDIQYLFRITFIQTQVFNLGQLYIQFKDIFHP